MTEGRDLDCETLSYDKNFFNPGGEAGTTASDGMTSGGFGDVGAAAYRFTAKAVLAVNLALVTGRPLLVRGPTGCGKSSLARAVARESGRSYFEQVITSRTEARDLLWQTDLVARLAEAQSANNRFRRPNLKIRNFIEPGVLWWGFDQEEAATFGREGGAKRTKPEGTVLSEGGGTVVLLDEIDKADPDLPDNLLVPLGTLSFRVPEANHVVEVKHVDPRTVPLPEIVRRRPLIIITTNREKELSEAFMRRCIDLELSQPQTAAELERIAAAHFTDHRNERIYSEVATRMESFIKANRGQSRRLPSTAEFLDAVRCCIRLMPEGCDSATFVENIWPFLTDTVLVKTR